MCRRCFTNVVNPGTFRTGWMQEGVGAFFCSGGGFAPCQTEPAMPLEVGRRGRQACPRSQTAWGKREIWIEKSVDIMVSFCSLKVIFAAFTSDHRSGCSQQR